MAPASTPNSRVSPAAGGRGGRPLSFDATIAIACLLAMPVGLMVGGLVAWVFM